LVKDGEHLLSGDRGIQLNELIDRFTTLKKVDQTLNGHAGIAEARHTAHSLGINPDHLIKPAFLFRGHISTLEQFAGPAQ
jgi:hypothetical protein